MVKAKFYKRDFIPPKKKSFFLFGPRGTGKTTWLRKSICPELHLNLLKSMDFLELESQPGIIRQKVEALPKNSWIFIDEIQKLPILLDEIQDLLLDYEDEYFFVLSGSSARKLKRVHGNLLAGRALSKNLFPLNSHELNFDFNLDDVLRFGTLPKIFRLTQKEEKIDFLSSYIDTYLKEEIQQEAAVRNLSKYHRFLRHAAMMNGQVLNLSEVSREVGVQRTTLDGYFKVLNDTLITSELPASLLKAKVKEVAASKVFFFDCGVVSALLNQLNLPLGTNKGSLFETFIINEVRSYLSYSNRRADIEYWGAHQGGEVDLIVTIDEIKIGIEIKSSKKYSKDFAKHLQELLDQKKIHHGIGVYCGPHELKDKDVRFLNFLAFLKKLHAGELF